MEAKQEGEITVRVSEATSLLDAEPDVVKLAAAELAAAFPQYESFGYVLLICSAFGFATMGLFVRIATGYNNFPVGSVMFIRGVLQTSAALSFIFLFTDYKQTFALSRKIFFMLFLRALGGALGMFLAFYGLSKLPMGINASIFFLNPIFTLFLSGLILGESFGAVEVAAAFCSFIGVVFVSNPTLQLDFTAGKAPGFALGCAASLLGAVVSAFTYCVLKYVSAHINFMMAVLSLGMSICLFGCMLGGASWEVFKADPASTKFVIIGCFFGFFGTCCMSKAFQYCRAGTGTLMRNIDVPIAYVFGVIFLNEIPHIGSVFGSALVILGTAIVGTRKMFARKEIVVSENSVDS